MSRHRDIKEEATRWADQNVSCQRDGLRVLDQLEQATCDALDEQRHSVEAYDTNGDAVYVNNGWRRLWGMEPHIMDDYNMLKDENLRTKVTWPAIERGFAGTAGPTPEASFSPEEIGLPGRHRWTEGYIAPVHGSDDHVARTVLMLRDIADIKLAMREIASLRNDLHTLQMQFEAISARMDKLASGGQPTSCISNLPPMQELRSSIGTLSKRERIVFTLLGRGKTVKEIAFDLGLGIKSVYTYRTRMMEKLNLQTDVQVAVIYRDAQELFAEDLTN